MTLPSSFNPDDLRADFGGVASMDDTLDISSIKCDQNNTSQNYGRESIGGGSGAGTASKENQKSMTSSASSNKIS